MLSIYEKSPAPIDKMGPGEECNRGSPDANFLLHAARVKTTKSDLEESSGTTATARRERGLRTVKLSVKRHLVLDDDWDSETMGAFTTGVTVRPVRDGRGSDRGGTNAVNTPSGVQQPEWGALVDLCPHVELENECVEQHENVGVEHILTDPEEETEHRERFGGAKLTRRLHVGLSD